MWRSFARRSFTTTMALRQSPPPLLFPRPTLRVPPPLPPAARFFSETSGNANEYKTPTARVGGAMLAVRQSPPPHFFPRPALRVSLPLTPAVRYFSAKSGDDGEEKTVYTGGVGGGGGGGENEITVGEVKKLMRLVNVEALKTKLAEEGKEVIGYAELLKACESLGVARSIEEAANFARVLDDAGVVLLFRDKVYLHPDKVVELVRSSVPLALAPADDPRREELRRLQERKEEIDRLAHRQVRYILWGGLGVCIMQVGLFFRLTFWEFSWDVMEPIAFFTTASGLVIGYAYFMITSKDPTYQDLMKTLFLSRQRKLIKKYNFDMNRFKELVNKCKCPFDKKHINESLVLENL